MPRNWLMITLDSHESILLIGGHPIFRSSSYFMD
jgi:hypothetical protein